jgi:hypothetical protein
MPVPCDLWPDLLEFLALAENLETRTEENIFCTTTREKCESYYRFGILVATPRRVANEFSAIRCAADNLRLQHKQSLLV